MLVIAHRGASADRPENTLAAFDLAAEQRADWIETDLHLTRDGVIALIHDEELARIGGSGVVGKTDWGALQALDAGGGERVPSLETALDHMGRDTYWNLEIKTASSGRYPSLEAEALRAVEKRGLADRVVYSSFDAEVLRTLRRYSPGARLGVLSTRRFGGAAVRRAARLARELEAVSIHPAEESVTSARVFRAHRLGVQVLPYTADTPADWERLCGAGVDGIFTNRPADLRSFLRGSA